MHSKGASWFSTLDLASGFNQVAVDEEDKAKTAFIPLGNLNLTGCPLVSVMHLPALPGYVSFFFGSQDSFTATVYSVFSASLFSVSSGKLR